MKATAYPILLLFWGACFSCTEIIPIDVPDFEPVLVVNATFNPDSAWSASLTQSQFVTSLDTPKAVTNGSITIWENGHRVDSLIYDHDDLYRSGTGHHPSPGIVYTLRAAAPGFLDVTGSDFAPAAVIPFAIEWKDSVRTDAEGKWLGEVAFTIDDPADVANNYILTCLWVELIPLFIDPKTVISYDYVMEGLNHDRQLVFQDPSFDGQRRTFKYYTHTDRGTDIAFVLQLSNVSTHYYQYTRTIAASRRASFNPYAEPVRVHSNMTSGMGIFAGYSTQLALIPL